MHSKAKCLEKLAFYMYKNIHMKTEQKTSVREREKTFSSHKQKGKMLEMNFQQANVKTVLLPAMQTPISGETLGFKCRMKVINNSASLLD
jgi:hypothetical protein